MISRWGNGLVGVARSGRTTRERRGQMIITLVTDTFNVGNNGTTVSAMRLADTLIVTRAHGPRSRVRRAGDATGPGPEAPMFWVPELVGADREPLRAPPAHALRQARPGGADRGDHGRRRRPHLPTLAAGPGRGADRPPARRTGHRRVPRPAREHHVQHRPGLVPPGRAPGLRPAAPRLLPALRRHPLPVDLHRGAATPPRVPGPAPRDLQRGGQRLPAGTGPGTRRRRAVPDPHGGPLLPGEAAGCADPGRAAIAPRRPHPACTSRGTARGRSAYAGWPSKLRTRRGSATTRKPELIDAHP